MLLFIIISSNVFFLKKQDVSLSRKFVFLFKKSIETTLPSEPIALLENKKQDIKTGKAIDNIDDLNINKSFQNMLNKI
ncbi:hypothetical protein [Pectobacterium brasiliense]|uniref:hypothetical protein n=1 Tax=Pectobacterium brasiliense TaxID=180957 RepID=UPI0039885A46